jgi:hypothetical protein
VDIDIDMDELREKEEELKRELEEFQKEKDKIKVLIGNIGGAQFSKKDTIINVVFLSIIILLFTIEITTHWLPSFISLELSVLLVSIKIVWMIHSQNRYNHFVFWILNSIEFRQNDIAKRMRKLEKAVIQAGDAPPENR